MLTEKKRYWIVLQKAKGVLTDQEIASAQQITRMTVHRLWTSYQRGGREALASRSSGRKIDAIPREMQHRILQLCKKQYGIHKIKGLLQQRGLQISKQKITKILQAHHLDRPAPEKGKRYHYIRWERNHSNSLWQTDYCWVERLGCWITAWLDDHSRLITAAEYVREATTENSIALFEHGVKRFGLPRETLSDRGA